MWAALGEPPLCNNAAGTSQLSLHRLKEGDPCSPSYLFAEAFGAIPLEQW